MGCERMKQKTKKTSTIKEIIFSRPITTLADIVAELRHILVDADYDDVNDVWSLRYTRQLVDKINNLSIKIYCNDHMPAHIHVDSCDGRVNARFEISSCSIMPNSVISSRDAKKIVAWMRERRSHLVEKWDVTRPTD